MIKKKPLVAALAATAALTMGLAGCGSSTASNVEAKATDEDVSIVLNWWGSDTRVKLTQQAVKKFEEAHPNVHVELQYSDWGGYWDKLATSVAGNNAPDVMQMDEIYLSTYASQGSLYDLDEASDYLDLGNMDESTKKMGQIDGTQYAAPVSITNIGVIVNMQILEDLGIELPDTTTWTWDDFEKVSQEVSAKSGGDITGSSPIFGGYDFQLWLRQHGVDSMFDGNNIASDDKHKELLVEYLQKVYDWTHGEDAIAGSPDRWAEVYSATNSSLPNTDFAKGKQAFAFGSGALSSQLSQYADALGHENLKYVPMPTVDGGKTPYYYMKPGMYWTISSKCEHPAEAAMLIDFLINDKEVGKLFGSDRGTPANNEIRSSLATEANALDKQIYDYIDQIKPLVNETAPDPTPNGGGTVGTVLQRYEQDVAFGNTTPEKAAADFFTEVQKELDNAA